MLNEEKEITIDQFFTLAEDGGKYEIETPQGWKSLKDLVKKRKICSTLRLEMMDGLDDILLSASDDHLVAKFHGVSLAGSFVWTSVRDIIIGDYLQTKHGARKVIEKVGIGEHDTYDFEVDSEEHAYYSNDVVSHNTGKTVLCKILAKEINHTIIYALPDHLGRTGDIKRVCEMAKDLAPCVLIIEDIDYIAEERDHARNAGGVIELMNYLDGVQEFNNVITLATTNAQEKIEEALKNRPGRFDRVVQVPRPNAECRLRMLKTFVAKFILLDDIDWDLLVDKTDKLSGAHVKDLVKTAAMHAIREKSVDENKKAIVGMKHFKDALDEVMNIDWSTVAKMQNKSRKMGFGDEGD